MTKTDLLALADKLEAADASEQRELLGEVWGLVLGNTYLADKQQGYRLRRFNAMLDAEAYTSAALTLIPDRWILFHLSGPFSDRTSVATVAGGRTVRFEGGAAATLSLAITSAALRARAEECE